MKWPGLELRSWIIQVGRNRPSIVLYNNQKGDIGVESEGNDFDPERDVYSGPNRIVGRRHPPTLLGGLYHDLFPLGKDYWNCYCESNMIQLMNALPYEDPKAIQAKNLARKFDNEFDLVMVESLKDFLNGNVEDLINWRRFRIVLAEKSYPHT